jgi:hypothetical protein
MSVGITGRASWRGLRWSLRPRGGLRNSCTGKKRRHRDRPFSTTWSSGTPLRGRLSRRGSVPSRSDEMARSTAAYVLPRLPAAASALSRTTSWTPTGKLLPARALRKAVASNIRGQCRLKASSSFPGEVPSAGQKLIICLIDFRHCGLPLDALLRGDSASHSPRPSPPLNDIHIKGSFESRISHPRSSMCVAWDCEARC